MLRSILYREDKPEVVCLDDVRNGYLDTIDICGPTYDWDIRDLMEVLATPGCSVHTLQIRWGLISDENLKTLVDHISRTNIHTINLEGNHIGDRGARLIASGTLKDSNVHTLHLGYNELGDSGVQIIHDGLVNIRSLSVGSNGLEHSAFANHTDDHFIDLDLGWNNIGDEGIHLLANGVKIKRLNLEGNRITDEGAKTIAQKLTQLEFLNISWNDLSHAGVGILRATPIFDIVFEGNLSGRAEDGDSTHESGSDTSSNVSGSSAKIHPAVGNFSGH